MGLDLKTGCELVFGVKKMLTFFVRFLGEEFLEFGKGFTERSLMIGSGCFPAQVADHEITMRVCLDFYHLCGIAFFTLITCLKNREKRDNILIAFIYIYMSYYIILYYI